MDQNERRSFLGLTLQNYLENTPDMIFVKDKALVYVAASDAFARLSGAESGRELVGKTDFEIFPAALAEKYTEDDRTVFRTGRDIVDYIEPLPDQGGRKSYSSTSKYLIYDEEKTVIGIYGVAKDVTAEVELQAARERNLLSMRMFDEVLEADLTENRLLNPGQGKWRCLDLLTEEETFSQTVSKLAFQVIHPDYAKEFLNYYDIDRLREAHRRGMQEFSHITYLRDNAEDEEYRWVEMGSQIYHSRVSNSLRLTTFLKDVDSEIRSKKRLEYEASTDALTGLYNRANILRQIGACLKEEGKIGIHALLFIDLDNFKQANDCCGHQFGDQVLQEVALRLRRLFSGKGLFGRIGGDEFLVFLRDVGSRENAALLADRVVEELRLRYCRDGLELEISGSVGVALCRGEECSASSLYQQADEAMYRAKEQGRARRFFYEDLNVC